MPFRVDQVNRRIGQKRVQRFLAGTPRLPPLDVRPVRADDPGQLGVRVRKVLDAPRGFLLGSAAAQIGGSAENAAQKCVLVPVKEPRHDQAAAVIPDIRLGADVRLHLFGRTDLFDPVAPDADCQTLGLVFEPREDGVAFQYQIHDHNTNPPIRKRTKETPAPISA